MPGSQEGFQRHYVPDSQQFLWNFYEMLHSNQRLQVFYLLFEYFCQAIQTKEAASRLITLASLGNVLKLNVPNPGDGSLF